jgi:hypothetical protein
MGDAWTAILDALRGVGREAWSTVFDAFRRAGGEGWTAILDALRGVGGEVWAAILGAVIGSTVSGIISYLLQRQTYSQEKKVREIDRLAVQKATGVRLFLKLSRIASNLSNLNKHMDEEYGKVPEEAHTEPWAFVFPIINLPDRIAFEFEELAYALSLKNFKMFYELQSLDMIHNTLIDTFRSHMMMRQNLVEKLPPMPDGRIEITAENKQQIEAQRPRMIEVNQVVTEMRRRSAIDAKESIDCLFALHKTLEAEVGLGLKIELAK